MIRRGTLILLGVFAVLLVLAMYLQKNPLPIGGEETPTPLPTEASLLLNGWQPTQITSIERQTASDILRLQQDSTGTWVIADDQQPVEAGVVQQALAELTSLRPGASLDPGVDLAAIGMVPAGTTIRLMDSQGQGTTLQIGGPTPTGSGYYVRLDDQAPVVVDTFAIDGILELLQLERLLPAAQPVLTPTVE